MFPSSKRLFPNVVWQRTSQARGVLMPELFIDCGLTATSIADARHSILDCATSVNRQPCNTIRSRSSTDPENSKPLEGLEECDPTNLLLCNRPRPGFRSLHVDQNASYSYSLFILTSVF